MARTAGQIGLLRAALARITIFWIFVRGLATAAQRTAPSCRAATTEKKACSSLTMAIGTPFHPALGTVADTYTPGVARGTRKALSPRAPGGPSSSRASRCCINCKNDQGPPFALNNDH